MLEREFQIPSPAGRALRLTAHLKDFATRRPVVLLCHGFSGFKDWGWLPYLATRFAEVGFAAIRMNFSHNGIGTTPDQFTEAKAFESNSFGKMLADIGAVLKTLERLPWADVSSTTLLGHSVGGGVVTLYAAQHPSQVARVIAWNPVAECDRFSPEAHQELAATGRVAYRNSRTGQVLYTGAGFFQDLADHPLERDICAAAASMSQPLLVVQGEADTTVLPAVSDRVAAAHPAAKVVRIPKAGHTFESGHPFTEASRELEAAIWASIDFARAKA